MYLKFHFFSLSRSSDFGTLYTKLNLQPGIATVIENFYICPTNKKKVGELLVYICGAILCHIYVILCLAELRS